MEHATVADSGTVAITAAVILQVSATAQVVLAQADSAAVHTVEVVHEAVSAAVHTAVLTVVSAAAALAVVSAVAVHTVAAARTAVSVAVAHTADVDNQNHNIYAHNTIQYLSRPLCSSSGRIAR